MKKQIGGGGSHDEICQTCSFPLGCDMNRKFGFYLKKYNIDPVRLHHAQNMPDMSWMTYHAIDLDKLLGEGGLSSSDIRKLKKEIQDQYVYFGEGDDGVYDFIVKKQENSESMDHMITDQSTEFYSARHHILCLEAAKNSQFKTWLKNLKKTSEIDTNAAYNDGMFLNLDYIFDNLIKNKTLNNLEPPSSILKLYKQKMKSINLDMIDEDEDEDEEEDHDLSLLEKADEAYYNTGKPIMTDKQYDQIMDRVVKKKPERASKVGHKVNESDKVFVKLPFWMGSMNKVKEENDIRLWKKKILQINADSFPFIIVSDKLDGVSALLRYNSSSKELKMYTRGDGYVGQDISNLVPYVLGPDYLQELMSLEEDFTVRGELVMSKKKFTNNYKDTFSNARNLVSGLVNGKNPDPKICKHVDFIVYDVLEPARRPFKHVDVASNLGLKYVNHGVYAHEDVDNILNVPALRQLLKTYKEEGLYEMDGLVIRHMDKKAQINDPGTNPSYAFAFKDIESFEAIETKVIEVEWTASKDGRLKPVVIFESVHISGVNIGRASGHNAEYIQTNKIGPGSIIEIVRSGDVIPYIKSVVKPSAKGPQMPKVPYTWSESRKDAIVSLENGEKNVDVDMKVVSNFFKVIGAKGIGEKSIVSLYENGFDTIGSIKNASFEDLKKAKIPGLGEAKCKAITSAIDDAFEKMGQDEDGDIVLMHASNCFEGLGERKLKSIKKGLDIENWIDSDISEKYLVQIEGVQLKSAQHFIDGLLDFRNFIKNNQLGNFISRKAITKMSVPKSSQSQSPKRSQSLKRSQSPMRSQSPKRSQSPMRSQSPKRSQSPMRQSTFFLDKKVVFTGFRDADLEKKIEKIGGKVMTSVSKNTDILVIVSKDGTKYDKALQVNEDLGHDKILIITKDDLLTQINA